MKYQLFTAFNIVIILIILPTLSVCSQNNLVPNGSFEEYHSCPTAEAYFEGAEQIGCKYWRLPGSGTADYYNGCQSEPNSLGVPQNCFGFQNSYSGKAYAGLGVAIRYNDLPLKISEYIQVRLLQPLEKCKSYHVKFWASLSACSYFGTNKIGLRFDNLPVCATENDSVNMIFSTSHIRPSQAIVTPGVWTLVSGTFTASGGEEFITIGGFWDELNSDVENPDHVECQLLTDEASYYFIDEVSVVEVSNLTPEIEIPNFFTPNNDGINDTWQPSGPCLNKWNCVIVNSWGESVYYFSETDDGWWGTDKNGQPFQDGVYFYILTSPFANATGFIHLIR